MVFFDFLTEEIAIDLGTANTLIIHNDKVVVDAPSIVARDRTTRKIIAVGTEANLMQGKTHNNIETIRPLKDGVIADFQVTEEMLKYFVQRVHEDSFVRPSPRILVCVPCESTQVERRAIRESVLKAGARDVRLIEEPMAAAIGAGLPVEEATGSMVVDI